MRVRRLAAAVFSTIALAAPTTARGQNLLTNPSFESGTTGYNQTVVSGFFTGPVIGSCSLAPGSGTGCVAVQSPASGPAGPAYGFFDQTVTGLTIGESYTASILFRRNGETETTPYLRVNGVQTNAGACNVGVACSMTYTFQATQTSTLFAFGAFRLQDANRTYTGGSVTFDNARLAATSTVPEPGTWALLGTGLAALGMVARRRRTA